MFLLHISALAQNAQTQLLLTFEFSENDSDANPDYNYLVLEKSIWFPDSHLKMCKCV